ncbi:dockerin type I repeat-containing protein, partial [Phascolarctobacterium succinatutens]
ANVNKSPAFNLKGDVNYDGVVNYDDVKLLKEVLIDKDVDYDAFNADMNGDGKITITDLDQLKILVDNAPNHTIYPQLITDGENTVVNQENTKGTVNSTVTTDSVGKET